MVSPRLSRVVVVTSLAIVIGVGCDFGVDVGGLGRCHESTSEACTPTDAAAEDAASPDVGVDATDASPSCPSARGAAMVRVTAMGGTYCVDVHEASNADYQAFLGSAPTAGTGACAGLPLVPVGWPAAPGTGGFPVTGVDYCQAKAFCAWAGKTLCGAVGGGPLAPRQLADPQLDAWTRACTGPSAAKYPYGDVYDPIACNGNDRGVGATLEVGRSPPASPRCAPDPGGPFDLSGNVWEWVDACEAEVGASDRCYLRGGAFNAPAAELTCAAARGEARSHGDATSGVRCCAR